MSQPHLPDTPPRDAGGLHIRRGVSSPWLVFTSAGDRSNVQRWIGTPPRFDLWVTYYGDAARSPHESYADYHTVRKGSKFQNLHAAYQRWPEIFERYEAVLVMDDDILIDAERIEALFVMRKAHAYAIVQPAFSIRGKISHSITRARRGLVRRETNFIEVNCPLFEQSFLQRFMTTVYDPILTGWGTDYLYIDMLGSAVRGSVAIIDAVPCINPHDNTKGGREIERLQSRDERRLTWQRFKADRGITLDEKAFEVFSEVRSGARFRLPLRALDQAEDWYYFRFKPAFRKVLRRVRRRTTRRSLSA